MMPSFRSVVVLVGHRVQGLPCSIIVQHLDLHLRLIPVVVAGTPFHKGPEPVEARVERQAVDYHLFGLFSFFFTADYYNNLHTTDHNNPDFLLGRIDFCYFPLSVLFQGVVVSALANNLLIWSINRKGPVFAAMFSPLLLVIVGMLSAICFAEKFHLGRC